MRVVVLAGGFGGARMAHGFALLDEAAQLTVVVNTADDLELHGLHISPDLDTVMYTLAGLANAETGWGVRDETWSASDFLGRYGEPTWFRLGDRDLATHIVRTARLGTGMRLTDVTRQMARALGIAADLVPMSDDRVRTKIRTHDGWLDFQDYFVRRGHADDVLDVRFDGAEDAHAAREAIDAVAGAELIVIAPSNPFVSVAPMLALNELRGALLAADAPVVAVSPIVGGRALRGPAAAMLRAQGRRETSAAVASFYAESQPGLVDVFVVDQADAAEVDAVRAAGIEPLVLPTVMPDAAERRRLAEELVSRAGAGF
jgi:LPPG:FO 2-phospho-L-lactate transferase